MEIRLPFSRFWIHPVFILLLFIQPPHTFADGEDTSGEGKKWIDVPPAPSEPDWQAWRERQNAESALLKPPAGPEAGFSGNPIDGFIQHEYAKKQIQPGELSQDSAFVRRVYLDVIGLLPPVGVVEKFVRDDAADKRKKLIDKLIADRSAYAEHWMTFWNDLLRNDEQTNIDNLRQPITHWLYDALLHNKSYDVMVAQLLNPVENGPQGFLKGINWRGRINASQRPVIQVAQNVGQVFLATTLKCASCHDHFFKPWKLKDTYGLASFFSPEPLEIYRCDAPTGVTAQARFSMEGFTEMETSSDLIARRAAAVQMVTSPKNPRFARTMVNRLWNQLIGRGLFEPLDDLDNQVFFPELMDWLTYDFMSHGYDIEHTLRLILTSDTYALASRPAKVRPAVPTYVSPAPRRMSSEQFLDGIYEVTNYFPKPDGLFAIQLDNPNVRTWRHKVPGAMEAALGRPNREQVVSKREDDATVIQMLEMVNGKQFDGVLKEAAAHLVESDNCPGEDLDGFVQTLFLKAYSRVPNETERALCTTILAQGQQDNESRKEHLEDLLWIVFMNPEFQFIQ